MASGTLISRILGVIRVALLAFILGNATYLANVQYPKATLKTSCSSASSLSGKLLPLTVISVGQTPVSASLLESIVASYAAGDDVFRAEE